MPVPGVSGIACGNAGCNHNLQWVDGSLYEHQSHENTEIDLRKGCTILKHDGTIRFDDYFCIVCV